MRTISSKNFKTLVVAGAISITAASGVAGYVWYENWRPPVLEIYIFALKSGQAIFIRTPSDKRILIDGGTNSEIVRRISSKLPFYSRRIDKVIVTKADGKHVSGLVDVIGRYSVGDIFVPGIELEDLGLASTTDQIYQTFVNVAQNVKVPIKEIVAGDKVILDENSSMSKISGVGADTSASVGSAVFLEVFFPATSTIVTTTVNQSEASSTFKYSKASAPELVARISYGSTSVMLAGSITPKIQKFVATSSSTPAFSTESGLIGIKSDVLIVSQNVTANNTTPAFIGKVAPNYLIYSRSGTTKSATLISTPTSTKEKPDPLVGIPEDHRFNIRDAGELKIVSDGKSIISISHP